jgi:hypothetical protein
VTIRNSDIHIQLGFFLALDAVGAVADEVRNTNEEFRIHRLSKTVMATISVPNAVRPCCEETSTTVPEMKTCIHNVAVDDPKIVAWYGRPRRQDHPGYLTKRSG